MALGQDMPSIAPEDYVTTPGMASAGPADTIIDKDDPSKYFTLQYYRDQIAQFQATLNQLDSTAAALNAVLTDPNLDPSTDADTLAQIVSWLDDYQAKKGEIQLAAKSVNAVVGAVNFFGAGMPTVTIPQSLQIVPAVAVAGAVAAVAAAAAIIAWAAQKIATAQQLTAQLQTLPPDQRAAALQQMQPQSAVGQIATLVKWIAIGALAWYGYRAFAESRA